MQYDSTPFAPLPPSARNTADRHPAVCAPRSRERQRCASPRTRLAPITEIAALRGALLPAPSIVSALASYSISALAFMPIYLASASVSESIRTRHFLEMGKQMQGLFAKMQRAGLQVAA